jgi:hypothetical protein
MPSLSPELRAARLALDYRSTMPLVSPMIPSILAYPGATAKTPVSAADGERGRATVYVVQYDIKHLVDAGKYGTRCQVRFDLGAAANYPFDPPSVFVVSTPHPWSPHVQPGNGAVCLGEIWSHGKGKMLLAQLVLHVARILNCDEPDRGAWYFGWNAAAIGFWRNTMKCRPVTPDLAYPVIPTDTTHGASPSLEGGGLRRVQGGDGGGVVVGGDGGVPPLLGGNGLRSAPKGLRSAKALGAKP